MEEHVAAILENQLQETIQNLKGRRFETYVCENRGEVLPLLDELIKDHTVVSNGGSVTLQELGILDYLKQRDVTFLDRMAPGLDDDGYMNCIREALHSDTYLMSSSAITRDGQLYNIDGNGNRLASLVFGPKQVLVIVGINKLVPDLEAARMRMRNLSAPANAHRLNCKTPCVKTGSCMDCRSADRICAQELITSWQRFPGRIKIIFVKETLGY